MTDKIQYLTDLSTVTPELRDQFRTGNLPPRLVERHGSFYIHHKSLTYCPFSWLDDWRRYLDIASDKQDSWFELPDEWALSSIREIETY